MASSEVEDTDLYHYDFTTASEWEVFIAKIEEIIHEWKLHGGKQVSTENHCNLFDATWETMVESVTFADVDFSLTRYYAKPKESSEDEETNCEWNSGSNLPKTLSELMSLEHDFTPVIQSDDGSEFHPHILVHWYGLSHFMVLNPCSGSIGSESQIKMLLSSCCMALNNTNCEVPLFIRALEPHQHFYLGIWEGEGIRTEFEMIHLHKVPSHCRYLTGLLNFFKSKIGNGVPVEPVTVSARFSYHLQDWTSFAWSQDLPSFEDLLPEKLSRLPFGATTEPISSMTLWALWPDVLETVVVDSESYTDFEPTQAVTWLISVHKMDNLLCLLSDYLAEVILLCASNRTSEELLGDFIAKETGDLGQPLNALTEPKLTSLSDILGHVSRRKESRPEGPLPTNLILPILYYLFPDATDNSKDNYPNEEADRVSHQGMKTCQEDSLVWRLGLVMAHAMNALGGVKAVAHIWHEFASEVRFRWATSTIIPGVASGFPDGKTCLLHQKLQMINCCIERKKEREKKSVLGNESESEEEFFDCNDEEDNGEREEGKQVPSGRLSQHGTLKLINTGQPLYIPITQGDSPKTEDQAEEDTQVLLKLGTDAEGSQLRARIMSPSLRSDMESFKAANPGAVFADFIRWQSPRDWVEEDEWDQYGQKKGHLSTRMLLPGNIWMEMWDSARSIPARLQKRLFDETTEAEKALHYIESQEPGRAAQSVLGVLFQAGLSMLTKEATETFGPALSSVMSTLERLIKKAEALSRLPVVDIRKYQELCFEMGRIEALLAQIVSLRSKFCPENVDDEVKMWLGQLISSPQVVVPGGPSGPIGTRIKTLLLEANKGASPLSECEGSLGGGSDGRPPSFPPPEKREFILRCHAPRYSPLSKPVPHRMMAAVTKSDIAVVAAFSQDSTFF